MMRVFKMRALPKTHPSCHAYLSCLSFIGPERATCRIPGTRSWTATWLTRKTGTSFAMRNREPPAWLMQTASRRLPWWRRLAYENDREIGEKRVASTIHLNVLSPQIRMVPLLRQQAEVLWKRLLPCVASPPIWRLHVRARYSVQDCSSCTKVSVPALRNRQSHFGNRLWWTGESEQCRPAILCWLSDHDGRDG